MNFAYGCMNLSCVVLPASVALIDNSAFYNCKSLTQVKIDARLGNTVFYGCESLTSADMDGGVTGVGNGAFANCTLLTSLNFPDSITSYGTQVIVYKIESQFEESVQWGELSKNNYQILDVIVRSLGTRHFSRLEIAQASGISPENMSYNLKMLKRFSVIEMEKDGSTNYIYCWRGRVTLSSHFTICDATARPRPSPCCWASRCCTSSSC